MQVFGAFETWVHVGYLPFGTMEARFIEEGSLTVVGIALADVAQRHPEPFATIAEFAYAVFTPIFFVSMAIKADFIKGFDPWLVALITVVAFLGKISGVFVGGKMAGMDNRQSLAVGCGLNARGILGIVMAQAACAARCANFTSPLLLGSSKCASRQSQSQKPSSLLGRGGSMPSASGSVSASHSSRETTWAVLGVVYREQS